MLRCYMLTVAFGSSVDQISNNFSIFNMIENVSASRTALGTSLPFEVHFYWIVDPDAKGQKFECRLVRVGIDGEDVGGPVPFETTLENDRLRLRVGALRMPHAFGRYVLQAEWRRGDSEEWHRDPAIWPLDFSEVIESPAADPLLSEPPQHSP